MITHLLARARPFARTLAANKFVRDTAVLQVAKFLVAGLGAASTFILIHFLSTDAYGAFGWAASTLAIWQSFDLTGATSSVNTRLALASGANDAVEVLNLMGFYARITLIVTGVVALTMILFAPLVTANLYGDPEIGRWAAWLGIGAIGDGLYGLILMSLSSRRQMRDLATLQTINQAVYSLALVGAAALRPEPASLVAGRVFYSFTTMAIAFWLYQRARRDPTIQPPHPPLMAVFAAALRAPVRPHLRYLRFGVAYAADRTLSAWFVQIPVQLVGAIGGRSAVGYLTLAINGITRTGMLTSALFENMQAVVPRAVGRGEYASLYRNFRRVLAVLVVGGTLVFGVFALAVPIFMPLFSVSWQGAIPALMILALYGAITTFGGIFGPLYRSLNRVLTAVIVKLIALAIMLPIGYGLLNTTRALLSGFDQLGTATLLGRLAELTGAGAAGASRAAAAGAWTIVGLFALSVGLTAAFALPALRAKARQAT